jgi:hypothetical protein
MRGRKLIPALAVAFTLAFAATSATAQTNATKAGPRFDKGTLTTITGTVREVTEHDGAMGPNGVYLVVDDKSGTYTAHVAPADFLKEFGITIKVGDHVEVTGSVVSGGAQKVILVTQIRVAPDTLRVRLDDGTTVWW